MGASVSLSYDGSRMAVGLTGGDGGGVRGADEGLVRVYEWAGASGSWEQLGADIVGEAANDRFGGAVSLSADGGRVAIGAAFNDGGDTNAGSVRIYAWNSTGWEQLGGDIDGESSYDYSGAGASVSLSANGIRVAIGAAANAGGSFKAGHVRVHALDDDSGDWAQLGADIDGADVYEQFGIAVSLSADGAALAVGSSSTSGAGHVRVYAWSSTAWVQLGTDIDGEADGDAYYGHAVSLASAVGGAPRVAIGASSNDGVASDAGHVRVYEYSSSGSWTQLGADIDGEAAYDSSGGAVALSADGTRVVVGATANDGNGADSGHVRVYDWDGAASAWAPVVVDIDGHAAGAQLGEQVALSGDGSRVAACYSRFASDAGYVQVFELPPWPSPPPAGA